eukprot:3231638-Prymnesium_polylepis.1
MDQRSARRPCAPPRTRSIGGPPAGRTPAEPEAGCGGGPVSGLAPVGHHREAAMHGLCSGQRCREAELCQTLHLSPARGRQRPPGPYRCH